MSVIAYRDGVLAGDSRASGGWGEASPGTKHKIRRTPDGELIGCCSNVMGGGETVMAWYEETGGVGPIDPPVDNFTLIVVTAVGEVYLADDTPHLSGPIESSFCAIGSGRKYALGAMQSGVSATAAVEMAIALDPFSGGPVDHLSIKGLMF